MRRPAQRPRTRAPDTAEGLGAGGGRGGRRARIGRTLTRQFHWDYIPPVEWEVEYTEEFEGWWNFLSEAEQEDVNAKVSL